MTEVFVEQPLALPGSTNYSNIDYVPLNGYLLMLRLCNHISLGTQRPYRHYTSAFF